MRLRLAAALLVGLVALAGCGEFRPDTGGGLASVPAELGGGAGPQEGSPGNSNNDGSLGSTTLHHGNR